MPELLCEPEKLRRRIEELEHQTRVGSVRDATWEALAEACFRLAVHPASQGTEAVTLLTRAYRLDGANPKYAYHLARTYHRHGHLERAKRWLELTLRLCPTSHRAWVHVSLLQRELNEQYRTDQTVLPDELRKRASRLVGEVKAGADRVDRRLLSLDPRKRRHAKGAEDLEPAPPVVRRVEGSGRCRWTGVTDLLAEQALEAMPSSRNVGNLRELLTEVGTLAHRRRGGATALAILGVEWMVRGYPPEFIRKLLAELPTPASDPSVQLLASCCHLMEVDGEGLPAELATAVHDGRLPPLLAAVIHERRLLWNLPDFGELGAVFRAAERFCQRGCRGQPGDAAHSQEAQEEARSTLERLRRAARELDCKPPASLSALPGTEIAEELRPENAAEAFASLEVASVELEGIRKRAFSHLRTHVLGQARQASDPGQRATTLANAGAVRLFVERTRRAARARLSRLETVRSAISMDEGLIADFVGRAEECRSRLQGLMSLGNFERQLRAIDRTSAAWRNHEAPASEPSREMVELLEQLDSLSFAWRSPAAVGERPSSPTELFGRRRREAGEWSSTLAKDWRELKELVTRARSGTFGDTQRAAVEAISTRLDRAIERSTEVERELQELKASGALDSEDAVSEMNALREAFLDLRANRGRFARRFAKLPTAPTPTAAPAGKDRQPVPGGGADAGQPFVALATALRDVEDRTRTRFRLAEESFSAYDPEALRLAPLQALLRTVRARKAEALYRLGRRLEARRIWTGLLRTDRLDPGLLENIAVCDTVEGELSRHLSSWRSYVEVLYFLDIVAGTPRPHASERAAFHREFAGAYAPAAIAQGRIAPSEVGERELAAFLETPRLGVFLAHKLLEVLNARFDYRSPPILLGVDRSARDDARQRARERSLEFVDTAATLLPERVRAAFRALLRRHVEEAFEASGSARRLTLKQDPHYSGEKDRFAKWLREFVQLKYALYKLVQGHLEALVALPDLAWIEQLAMLDAVPLANSPEFLQQFVDDWEQVAGLMTALKHSALVVAANQGRYAALQPYLRAQLERGTCPAQLFPVAIRCEIEAVERLKEKAGKESFDEALDTWIQGAATMPREAEGAEIVAGDPGSESVDASPLLDALREARGILAIVERGLRDAREALADSESVGQERGPERLSTEELDQLDDQLENARGTIFLAPLFERLSEAMAGAEGGIRTTEQAETLCERLDTLHRTLSLAEPLFTGMQGYEKLSRAVRENLARASEAATALSESQAVGALVTRFHEFMAPVKEGRLSSHQAEELEGDLRSLDRRVATLAGTVKAEPSTKALIDLRAAIARILDQLGA